MLKPPSSTNWQFEGFQVMTEMRLLIAGGTPVPLTSKAFDTLVVLIENRDRVVTKDELLRAVWPDVEVEEGNLTQQVFLLRKALGETAHQPHYIVTVPGRGYRFTGPVTAIADNGGATVTSTNVPVSPPAAPRRGLTITGTGLAVFGVVALAMVLGSRWIPTERTRGPLAFSGRIGRVTESGRALQSAMSRDGRYVAYVEHDGDDYSLWVARAGGDGRHEVVASQPRPLGNLTFSPDGETLYFARASALGVSTLFRVPVLGGPETPVLDDVDSPISFSPDGREFVFHRGADPESHLVVADVGGRTQRILAVQKVPARFSPYAPDWSPDGTVVAAGVTDMRSTSQTIVLLPVGGGASRQLFTSEGLIGRLRWLPDGSGLLAVISEGRARRQYAGLRGGALWRIDYPGGRAERLTSDLDGPHPCCLDIDANGRVVATVVNKVVSDLWIAPADRLDAPRQVTWDRPVVGRHSWLPDNDTLVYRDLGGRLNVVHKNGRASRLPVPDGQEVGGGVSACGDGRRVVFAALPGMNLWRVGLAPDAGGLHKLTAGLNDFNPACSRDGQWVFFASREPDHVSLWRVSIEGGTPTPLGPVSAYDVLPSPGGGMIYYATDELRESDRSTTRAGTRIRQDRWVVISSSDQARLAELDVPRDITFGTLPNWTPDESGLDYVVTRNGMSNIWRQPLAGGPPLQITNLSLGRIFSFAWSPDGRWLSIGAGAQRADVVLMSSEP